MVNRYSFTPNRVILSLIKEKKITDFYKMNGLLNWGLFLVMQELENKNPSFEIFKKMTKEDLRTHIEFSEKRSAISKKRKLNMRRAFLINNFESNIKNFMRLRVDIKRAIAVLEDFYDEAILLNMKFESEQMRRIIDYLIKKQTYSFLSEYMGMSLIITKQDVESGKEFII